MLAIVLNICNFSIRHISFLPFLELNRHRKIMFRTKVFLLLGLMFGFSVSSFGQDLVGVVAKISPSVVGVGTLTPIRGNNIELKGTGFVFGNGTYIATNHHVVGEELSEDMVQHRVVMSGSGKDFDVHIVEVVDFDPLFDLAILKIKDQSVSLPNHFTFADDKFIPIGTKIAFTGFPIGAILGLYPSTHIGIIAAITPDALPANSAKELNPQLMERLRKKFNIYQLDAIAYPGNSGSPLYDQETGRVIGVINKVLAREGREYALSAPTGISYAIPVKHLRNLATRNNITLN